jgi:soluble lytic murein transglycosylase-like protein
VHSPTINAWVAGLLLVVATVQQQTHAHCFKEASARYHVPASLLRAIAKQESGGQPAVVHLNNNGTRDIGLMQINSVWLPLLRRHGLQEQDLYDPCVNVLIAAWILSNNFSAMGYTTQALGAYNATTPWKREKYARQILQSMGVDVF